jgi:hypothetical protein
MITHSVSIPEMLLTVAFLAADFRTREHFHMTRTMEAFPTRERFRTKAGFRALEDYPTTVGLTAGLDYRTKADLLILAVFQPAAVSGAGCPAPRNRVFVRALQAFTAAAFPMPEVFIPAVAFPMLEPFTPAVGFPLPEAFTVAAATVEEARADRNCSAGAKHY